MCDYVVRQEPIDMAEYMPAGSGKQMHNVYCSRTPQFWVQSLLSQHNSHVCSHHLARTVRDIEKEARKYDLMVVGEEEPDPRYSRGYGGKRMTREQANYARVTVKPYAPKER